MILILLMTWPCWHTPNNKCRKKTTILTEQSAKVGLKININKTKVLKIKAENQNPIMAGEDHLGEVDQFTYLGSIVDLKGGTDADIKVRIGKARSAYKRMKNVWNSSSLKTRTKVRIFNSTIKPVLLYGSETWRMNDNPIKKVQSFINTCLRRILKIHWPERISNDEQ